MNLVQVCKQRQSSNANMRRALVMEGCRYDVLLKEGILYVMKC